MIKIDLHIHTIATASDSAFDFELDKLKAYVAAASLDAIAITNHNVFDFRQFEDIRSEVEASVFPGIEVDVDGCHILVIADPGRADKLALASERIGGPPLVVWLIRITQSRSPTSLRSSATFRTTSLFRTQRRSQQSEPQLSRRFQNSLPQER